MILGQNEIKLYNREKSCNIMEDVKLVLGHIGRNDDFSSHWAQFVVTFELCYAMSERIDWIWLGSGANVMEVAKLYL